MSMTKTTEAKMTKCTLFGQCDRKPIFEVTTTVGTVAVCEPHMSEYEKAHGEVPEAN
jgi:hypothetical protein